MGDPKEDLIAIFDRLTAVEKVQALNLPKFVNALRRLAAVEKKTELNVANISAVKQLAVSTVEANRASNELITINSAKVDELLDFAKRARTWGGFARRHGPRVFAFIVGIAIAKGWISGENGTNFLHLFGL